MPSVRQSERTLYETYEWRKYCAQGGKIRILLAAGHLLLRPAAKFDSGDAPMMQ